MAVTSRVIGSFSFVIQMINDASDNNKKCGLACKMILIKKLKAKQGMCGNCCTWTTNKGSFWPECVRSFFTFYTLFRRSPAVPPLLMNSLPARNMILGWGQCERGTAGAEQQPLYDGHLHYCFYFDIKDMQSSLTVIMDIVLPNDSLEAKTL